jgi:hypothetical protein
MIRRQAGAPDHTFPKLDHEPIRQPLSRRTANYGAPLPRHPKIKKITQITRNRKNKNLAIPADAAAIPPNPNTAATSAIIKKVTAQPNIVSPPLAVNRISRLPRVYIISGGCWSATALNNITQGGPRW